MNSRRNFLKTFGTGIGALALMDMQQAQGGLLAPKEPQFDAKAKRMIHIYQSGAQSHLETWDHKPELASAGGRNLAPQFEFTPAGQSGVMMSEVWQELRRHVDDMSIINSMHTEIPAHGPATLLQTTGDFRLPKPSLGSWVLYGLGTENQNLPGFVSMNPGGYPGQGPKNWQSAFMPGAYQGTFVDPMKEDIEDVIENISNGFTSMSDQRDQLDLLAKLNEVHKQERQGDAQFEARIESFELAFKMQTDATTTFDVSLESETTRERYGMNHTDAGVRSQARQFLIARRLLERGVRYVQVWNGGWDTHNNARGGVARNAMRIDQPIAAFLDDLKQSGMFSDTLVVSSTEFGRSPREDGPGGRAHNARAFSSWMAGAGIRGGYVHGSTDELGGQSVDDKVHVHELHSTILHAMGFNSETFTYRNSGRDFRLTDVSKARPVRALFA